MLYAEFKKLVDLSKAAMSREIFLRHPSAIKIKKEQTVVRNLERIFSAALKISNRKGFQAMSMRDLSDAVNMSMGGLYAYFSSKEALLAMLQDQRRAVTQRILEDRIAAAEGAGAKLRMAVQTHLYLSETMQPWFYFSYMEARHLSRSEQQKALESELYTEQLFEGLLQEVAGGRSISQADHRMFAGLLKAMLQDWYLKRWKYRRRKISVDRYAAFVIEVVHRHYGGLDGEVASGQK